MNQVNLLGAIATLGGGRDLELSSGGSNGFVPGCHRAQGLADGDFLVIPGRLVL